jgi:hypothetical protein
MGSTVKHTDLSWEIPSLRADIDLPFEDFEFWVPESGTGRGGNPGRHGAWDLAVWDDSAEWPDA